MQVVHASASSSTGTSWTIWWDTSVKRSAEGRVAKPVASSTPLASSTLTENRPASRISTRVADRLPTQASTSSGSRESEVTALAVMPVGPAGVTVASTVTPEASWAKTERNSCRACSGLVGRSPAASGRGSGTVIVVIAPLPFQWKAWRRRRGCRRRQEKPRDRRTDRAGSAACCRARCVRRSGR